MAGLLAIPMVLLGRLYGSTLAGIGAACIAVVAFSYFNRTNAGYYDTDMFSVTVPAFILYFLLRAHRQESFFWLTAAALIFSSHSLYRWCPHRHSPRCGHGIPRSGIRAQNGPKSGQTRAREPNGTQESAHPCHAGQCALTRHSNRNGA